MMKGLSAAALGAACFAAAARSFRTCRGPWIPGREVGATAYLPVAGCDADLLVLSGIPRSGALSSLAEFIWRPLGGGKLSKNPRFGLLSGVTAAPLLIGGVEGAELWDSDFSGTGA